MSRPISSIRNLGPASEAAFARAGIHTADEIESLGADEAYLRLLQSGSAPHFIGYYVLVMGLQGRPWNDCKGKEKELLRVRFDALKARALAMPTASKDHKKLEAIFDELGLRARR
ncbi:MAG TPA: TfoX/Sxy family DNA transformation protein [Paracoccaceae bacterium]|nr:TfoX/Sxy family DNA transformation protein [Paracoccaceae bacterium]